ncbi:Porphobilinogen deaminase [Mannheimia haemolytica]|uniref:Porphobilinogen deaminase n=1 Tax=Mannheimia haemolytica TaxID=75985 RepID=A0A378NAA9_MANHA|nr:Porphobilinogen deaminase [Mannheimia haemolytica]
MPIGGYATLEGDELTLNALVGSLDGSQIIRASAKGHKQEAEQLGILVAEQLLAQGADKILAAVYNENVQ